MSGDNPELLSEPLLNGHESTGINAPGELSQHSQQSLPDEGVPGDGGTNFRSRRENPRLSRVRFSLEEPTTIDGDGDSDSDSSSFLSTGPRLTRCSSPLFRQQSLYCGPDTMLQKALKKDWGQSLSAMESLDYDNVDNRVFREFGRHQSNVAKWLVNFMIGKSSYVTTRLEDGH